MVGMVTTIQLSEGLKQKLKSMKKNANETYEDVIMKLILESKKITLKSDLIEGYKEMGKDSLNVLSVWETAVVDWD